MKKILIIVSLIVLFGCSGTEQYTIDGSALTVKESVKRQADLVIRSRSLSNEDLAILSSFLNTETTISGLLEKLEGIDNLEDLVKSSIKLGIYDDSDISSYILNGIREAIQKNNE